MNDQNNAAFVYSVNMLRMLLAMNLISEEEYKKLSSACTSIRVMLISSINTTKKNAK